MALPSHNLLQEYCTSPVTNMAAIFFTCDRQFKLKMQRERKGDETLWSLLVKKVASARVMSSLSLPKRKREEPRETIHDHGIRNFRK